jgi:hypothetical protein
MSARAGGDVGTLVAEGRRRWLRAQCRINAALQAARTGFT